MVCISCVVIPVLLWIFHKFIRPLFNKFIGFVNKDKLKNDEVDQTKTENRNGHPMTKDACNGSVATETSKTSVSAGDAKKME